MSEAEIVCDVAAIFVDDIERSGRVNDDCALEPSVGGTARELCARDRATLKD